MSEITIKRIGSMGNDGYWQASDGSWSPNGVDWLSPDGELYSEEDYIQALKLHLDSLATEPEPERAKVGIGCVALRHPNVFESSMWTTTLAMSGRRRKVKGGLVSDTATTPSSPSQSPRHSRVMSPNLNPACTGARRKKLGLLSLSLGVEVFSLMPAHQDQYETQGIGWLTSMSAFQMFRLW